MKSPFNLYSAVDLCREIEKFAPLHGYHVALTGGCLYKDGDRKDVDIMLYKVRQGVPNKLELLKAIATMPGMTKPVGRRWLYKAEYRGKKVDFLFPDTPRNGNDEYI